MGRLKNVALMLAGCGLGLAMAVAPAMAQVTTTTIADTIYRADGTYAAGSLLISWPEFSTASNLAVPAGRTTVTIGANGAVSFPLSPNAGATPAGTYYTVVYQLNDGTVSTEYWSVPATSEATIASVRSSVVPATVAVQGASVSYVNGAVADAVAAYLPLSGGTLAGPLDLNEDPVGSTEAATKHYVDVNVSSVTSGIAGKVNLLPSSDQSVVQPAGTTLSVNSLQNILSAGPSQSGSLNNGISNSFSSATCAAGGCMVVADPQYSTTEEPQGHPFPACSLGGEGNLDTSSYCAYNWPFNTRLWDQRAGTDIFSYQDPLNRFSAPAPGQPLTASGFGNSGMARHFTYDYVADRGNAQITPEVRILHSFAGGHNAEGGYNKSNYALFTYGAAYFSRGQHDIGLSSSYCLGLGDCLGAATRIYYSVGLSRGGDEGIHRGDSSIDENFHVFHGTVTAGAGAGSTALTVTPAANTNGDQGEGRYLIDLSQASAGNLGSVTGSGQSAVGNGQIIGWINHAGNTAPAQMIAPTGTFTASSLVATSNTAVAATSGVVGTQTITLSVTSGAPALGSPICISDNDNYEIATVSAVNTGTPSVTANFIRTHFVGALVTQGGTCGWFAAMNSETLAAGAEGNSSIIRYVLPLIGSSDSAHTYYWYSIGGSYGAVNGGGTNVQQSTSVAWSYMNGTGQSATCNAACLAGTGPVSVTTSCSGCTFYDHNTPSSIGSLGNIVGQVVTISGASDANYNGTFTFSATPGAGLAVITGPNKFTYTPAATPGSGSQSVALNSCNCTFTMYPGGEVTGVFNTATQTVDGTLKLAGNAVTWVTNDQVEEPHWHLPYIADRHDVMTPFEPMVSLPWGRGYSYQGTVTGNLHGFELNNNGSTSLYYGLGGTHNPPADAFSVGGYWETLLGAGAPSANVVSLGCKPASAAGGDGCTKWDADFGLFSLPDHNGGGQDWMYFYPQSDTLFESFGGVKLYLGSDVTDTAQNIYPTAGSAGMGLTGSLYASGLWLGAQSGWGGGTPVTGVAGTGSNLLTDNGATIASGKTLTVAGTLNVTGSCTGCGSPVIPGTSGNVMVNSSGALGAIGTTGSGSAVLATNASLTNPTVNSVLNLASGAWISMLSGTATSGTPTVTSDSMFYNASVWNGSTACGLSPYLRFSPSSPSTWTFLFGGVNRTSCSGITPVIEADFSSFLDGIIVPHVLTTGGATTATAPTIAAGSGAGSAPTVTLSNARDTDGTINVTTGTSPGASSVVATLTFGTSYQGTPNCQVTPASASAMNTIYSPPANSGGFAISTGGTALTAATSYTYTYHCLQ
jgi:hypothetical protein